MIVFCFSTEVFLVHNLVNTFIVRTSKKNLSVKVCKLIKEDFMVLI